MESNNKTIITVQCTIPATIDLVWECWTAPKHIIHWNHASPDWHTPRAENDLRAGGKFLSRMEAKDGSFGFDFSGVYDEILTMELINYTADDGRKVIIRFVATDEGILITESFEAEGENPVELQRAGWQSIMDNFKNYVESL